LERKMMETSVRKFFERYESFFNQSLGGERNMDEVAALYASEFIAASPAGVMTGKNDDQLKQVMVQSGRSEFASAPALYSIVNPAFPLLIPRVSPAA
jgi:hypothetical protein